MRMHADQRAIEPAQVVALVSDQAPRLRGEPVVPLPGSGTVNAIFRIGRVATARFPLRPRPADVLRAELEREASASAEFVLASPFAAPEPILLGEPGHGYPLPWVLQTWLDGHPPTPTSAADSTILAADLARLIDRLRGWNTGGRVFDGDNRGGRLVDHDDWMAECIVRSEGLFDTNVLRRLWAGFRRLPRAEPDVMCHTDLIPGNLLVTDGRLSGVLDTGGFRAADPALDLVCAWHLFEGDARAVLRTSLGCSDLQWERGRAWAFEQAVGAYWYYLNTNPAMAAMGRTTLERLAASA